MTEQQAIKQHIIECRRRIDTIQNFMETHNNANHEECVKNIHILKSTIQALEEHQAYKEIGTIEEYREAVERRKEN